MVMLKFYGGAKMKELLNYREVDKFRKADEYIDYFKKVGMEKFVEVIRISGLLTNPYDGKWRDKKLFDDIDNYLKNEKTSKLVLWQNIIEESHIINELYSDLYTIDVYQKAESIPKEYAFTSSVLILERYLRILVNEIEGKNEKNNELQFIFHADFAYAKKYFSI